MSAAKKIRMDAIRFSVTHTVLMTKKKVNRNTVPNGIRGLGGSGAAGGD